MSYLIVGSFLLIGLFMLVLAYLQITQFTTLSIRIEQKSAWLHYGLFKVLVDREKIEKVYLDTANTLLAYEGWD